MLMDKTMKKKRSGVYQIRNKNDNHCYIGGSKNIYRRWRTHKNSLNGNYHHNSHLQNAWDKYGEQSFVFEPLLLCNKNDVVFYEQKFLDIFNPHYNIAKDATRPMLGRSHSDKTKAKMSAIATGRCFTEEHCKNIAIAKSNISEETRRKIGASSKGRKFSNTSKEKLSKALKKYYWNTKDGYQERQARSERVKGHKNPMFGKTHSKQAKEKISATHKGKTISEEQKAIISKASKNNQYALGYQATRKDIRKRRITFKQKKMESQRYTSNFLGVKYNKASKKWESTYTNYGGERLYLGSFQNEVDAAKAYNRAAKEDAQDLAIINDIEVNLEAKLSE